MTERAFERGTSIPSEEARAIVAILVRRYGGVRAVARAAHDRHPGWSVDAAERSIERIWLGQARYCRLFVYDRLWVMV